MKTLVGAAAGFILMFAYCSSQQPSYIPMRDNLLSAIPGAIVGALIGLGFEVAAKKKKE